MAEMGIRLSTKQKKLIASNFANNQQISVNFEKWKFWSQRHVQIDLTKDDIAEIESKAFESQKTIEKHLLPLTNELAERLFQDLKRRWPKLSRTEQKIKHSFESRNIRLWSEPIALLSMDLGVSREFGENLNDRLRQTPNDGKKFSIEVLTRLHARACQIVSEVITLLSAGFADGAMARWRTLHEVAVTALFISDNGELAAERYTAHEAIETHLAAKQYEKFREFLSEQPVEQSDLSKLENAYNAAIERFGKNFSEKYGWASNFLNKAKPTFADIEQSVKVGYIRPYYRMASYNVHATPKGAFFKLGLIPKTNILLAGPTDFGLAYAGRSSGLTLAQASLTLLSLDCTLDSLVTMRLIDILSRQSAGSFIAVQSAIEEAAA